MLSPTDRKMTDSPNTYASMSVTPSSCGNQTGYNQRLLGNTTVATVQEFEEVSLDGKAVPARRLALPGACRGVQYCAPRPVLILRFPPYHHG